MSESEGATPSQAGSNPSESGNRPPLAWRERAAFHITIHSATSEREGLIWETRADQEERGISMTWPGMPGQELLDWMINVVGLSEAPGAGQPPAGAPGVVAPAPADEAAEAAPEAPVDDLTRINGITPATAQRLRKAGIGTFAQLAGSSAEELGELLKRPAESIAKRGWIEQARMLAEASKAPVPPTLSSNWPGEAAAAAVIEVRLDANGEVLDLGIVREGQPPAPESLPGEGQIVRFFVQPAPPLHEPAQGGPYELFLDELALEQLPTPSPAGVTRLCARSTLHLAATGGGAGAPVAYTAVMVASDLETGATTVLQSASGQVAPPAQEAPLELTFELPMVGRYQTLLVAMLSDTTALAAVAGPRLRVLP
ncbi:MAG: helix-hairpin-helix domain-containing protein [Chloroflexaceae bacterium]